MREAKLGPAGTDPLEENKLLKFFKKKKKNITQLLLVLSRCAAMPTSTQQLGKQRQIAHVARLKRAKLVLLHQ